MTKEEKKSNGVFPMSDDDWSVKHDQIVTRHIEKALKHVPLKALTRVQSYVETLFQERRNRLYRDCEEKAKVNQLMTAAFGPDQHKVVEDALDPRQLGLLKNQTVGR